MNEMPKPKSGWRWRRRILIALAVLATLIAIFYTEEDWRGKRAWETYKHQLEAKGEKLDWQAFVPPTVPDDENFFCAPIFTKIKNDKLTMTPYGSDGGPDFPSYKDLPSNKIGYMGSYRETITDLKVWQTYYRNPTNLHAVVGFTWTNGVNGGMSEETNYLNHAIDEFPISPEPQTPAKDVLYALSKYDSAVEELREASQRPYANVPLNYEDGIESATGLLPVLAELKRFTQLLQLRASAELADGQNEKALADVKLMLYLNNSLRTSPFLISGLVRFAIVAISLQPIWEGLAKHEWSDEQLATLEDELSKVDFLADYGFIMRGERAFAIKSFENQRITRQYTTWDNALETNIVHNYYFMPAAFFYQNELAIAQMHQQWILPLVDTNSRTISPEKFQRANDANQAAMKHYSPYKVQALMLFPAIGATVRKIAAIQSSIDLARVACALERYRLANGNFPDSLDALVPQFIAQIPHDIIGGQPLHYRLEANGQFILYSVGWNETDDGGVVVFTKDSTPRVDINQGDWVWQYPTK